MSFLPLFLNAQGIMKKEINNYLDKGIYTMQELKSNLLDEYGIKNIQFVKLENGKYIPVKTETKNISEGQVISENQFSSDTIIIFAIIGAVLVALILLRSL